jgi:SAM-dependent methyltransferase
MTTGTESAASAEAAAQPYPRETAADSAAVSTLLVVGDRLGIVAHFEAGRQVGVTDLAAAANLPKQAVADYLHALTSAGVVEPVAGAPEQFVVTPDFTQLRYEAGYMSWLMNANRPFIEFAREFIDTPQAARKAYPRDGREVAVSSQWAGTLGFYSVAFNAIMAEKPGRFVDLGAGTARLLISVLQQLPGSTGLALDLDSIACAEARKNADNSGIGDRLTVVERSIQSLADDPSPVVGADVVHGGFVFHDMMPDEEDTADAVMRRCCESLNSGGVLAITDAVPFAQEERERRFSAAMSYLHYQFMGRRFLTEDQWQGKLVAAGFGSVEVHRHRMPGARLYVARKH